jgi:hypothetical protein
MTTTRKAMNAVALAIRICPPPLMATLAAIVEAADRRGQCRLSHVDIGRLSGQSERTVCDKLRKLEALGIVATTHRHDRRGQAPNLTTLTIAASREADDAPICRPAATRDGVRRHHHHQPKKERSMMPLTPRLEAIAIELALMALDPLNEEECLPLNEEECLEHVAPVIAGLTEREGLAVLGRAIVIKQEESSEPCDEAVIPWLIKRGIIAQTPNGSRVLLRRPGPIT